MKKWCALLLSLMLLLVLTGCDSADYQKAVSMYESGAYAEAMELFAALGDYEDSADLATDCQYQIALGLMEAGNYQQAKDAFESLGDYQDSGEQTVLCVCQLAQEYAQSGKLPAATELLAAYSTEPKVQEQLFVLFSNEVIDYMENFQAALDSWNEYTLIWLKALQANGNKVAAGQSVDIPKVDESAPQVIALRRSMEKAAKSVEKLQEAYGDEISQACDEELRNLINTFFASAQTIDEQFQYLDNWVVSMTFYALQENNAGKANNKWMNAIYAVQDALEILGEKYGM